ncbi:MAG TPA: NAD(P)H-dependent oxidoreductase [Bacteroidota bacterium]|nr:NAD(P)H-dependent oxidoreductase [Bacteroidota bacterium]
MKTSKEVKSGSNIRVVGISGSTRTGSYTKLVLNAALQFAEAEGAEVATIDLKDLALPMYDQDLEAEGLPDSVIRLKKSVEDAGMLIIATPEHNHTIPAVLKNAIDWLTRGGNNSFSGKAAAIISQSPGQLGGMRAQAHLRQILTALDVYMVPQPQANIPAVHELFRADGTMTNQKIEAQLKLLIHKTIRFANVLQD